MQRNKLNVKGGITLPEADNSFNLLDACLLRALKALRSGLLIFCFRPLNLKGGYMAWKEQSKE